MQQQNGPGRARLRSALTSLNDLQLAGLIALTGPLICFAAFGVNWWITEGPYPGYRLLAYPGIQAAKLFSEEINFWPKLVIILGGQYAVYFCFAYVGVTLFRRKN